MKANFAFTLACLATILPAQSAIAQAGPPASTDPASKDCAPRPAVKPNSWVTIDSDGRRVKSTVTEVDDSKITLKRESLSSINRDNGTDVFSREWASFSGPSSSNPNITLTFTPSFNLFKFPMCVGDSHEQKVNWQVQGGTFSGLFTLKSKVAARDKVSIGGKDFEVFRVEWDTGSQGGSSWYSPELARTVKSATKVASWIVTEYGGY